jgi:hypothetical protein
MGPYTDVWLTQAVDEKHHRPTQGVAQVSQAMSQENQLTTDGEQVMHDESDSGKDLS